MKTCHVMVLFISLGINLNAVLSQEMIIATVPEKIAPALADRVITTLGCDHVNFFPKEGKVAQTNKLMQIFEKQENIPDARCHVMVESVPPLVKGDEGDGVLYDLLNEMQARKFKNTTFENSDFRLVEHAAHTLLYELMPLEASYLDEAAWIEKLRNHPILESLPPELRTITINDSSDMHKNRCLAAIDYKIALKDPIKKEEFEKIFDNYYKIHTALLYASRARESFPFDMRRLTFQHIDDEFNKRAKIAWQQYDELQDPVAKEIYKTRLEGALIVAHDNHKFYDDQKYFDSIDKNKTVLEISLELAKDVNRKRRARNRHSLYNALVGMFSFFMDLNLFYKIIMLEQNPEIKKIIIIGGTKHNKKLFEMLEDTKRYRCLMQEVNYPIQERVEQYGEERIIRRSVPLRMYIIELVEPPRKNLEWEIFLKKWFYPPFWHLGFSK